MCAYIILLFYISDLFLFLISQRQLYKHSQPFFITDGYPFLLQQILNSEKLDCNDEPSILLLQDFCLFFVFLNNKGKENFILKDRWPSHKHIIALHFCIMDFKLFCAALAYKRPSKFQLQIRFCSFYLIHEFVGMSL